MRLLHDTVLSRLLRWATGLSALGLVAQSSAAQSARASEVSHPAALEGAPLTIAAAIDRALAANPDVVTARTRIDSARAERTIARALPNPTLSATPSNPSQFSAQLPLDIGPARYYRAKVSGAGEAAAQLDSRDVVRQTVFAVRQAFYDILLADSLRALAADQVQGFRRLLAADSARLRAGSIADRDLTNTRLQLAHADAILARSVVQQHSARLTLQLLMGITAPDTSLPIAGHLDYHDVHANPDSVLAAALARRPDLAAATVRVSQSMAARSLARSNLVPLPLVGGVYQPAQPFASGSHYALAVGVTLPLFYAFRGERARANAGLAAARVAAARTNLQLRADVSLAYDNYLTARELSQRYACGLLAEAQSALEAARYAYDRGATSLVDLLEAVRAYGDTRSDYLNAVHDYWVSVFALERAAGEDFVKDVP